MNEPIPFYKSKVFVAAVLGFFAQVLVSVSEGTLLERLLAGDKSAAAQLLGIISTAGAVMFRAISPLQPLTMGKAPVRELPVILAGAAVLCMGLAGCKTIEQNPATAQLVTRYAVVKYLEKKPTAEQRYASAQRIVAIATDLRSVTAGSSVSLQYLRDYLGTVVELKNLSPADKVLADGLVNVLFTELESRFKGGGGLLSPDQLIVVNDVLSWISSEAGSVQAPA